MTMQRSSLSMTAKMALWPMPASNAATCRALIGNNNHSMRGGTGEASWTFTGLAEGQYFVSATWNHIYENRYNTDKAPFSITNGSGNLLTSLTVDQTQSPADFTDGGYGWKDLTPVYINDGTLIVTLGASPTNHMRWPMRSGLN